MESIERNRNETNPAIFSVATFIYMRLRRVTGRVIDVLYLSESQSYAKMIIQLALDTEDDELVKHALALEALLGTQSQKEPSLSQSLKNQNLESSYEPTEEEIYKAQVSHHYIGSLR